MEEHNIFIEKNHKYFVTNWSTSDLSQFEAGMKAAPEKFAKIQTLYVGHLLPHPSPFPLVDFFKLPGKSIAELIYFYWLWRSPKEITRWKKKIQPIRPPDPYLKERLTQGPVTRSTRAKKQRVSSPAPQPTFQLDTTRSPGTSGKRKREWEEATPEAQNDYWQSILSSPDNSEVDMKEEVFIIDPHSGGPVPLEIEDDEDLERQF